MANHSVKQPTFLTEADQESATPKKTIKKNGPQRSQSLNAFPGSSLKGLGNTTSFKLLTILHRSLFTVSKTGSVNVFGDGPNPLATMLLELPTGGGGGGAAGTGCNFWREDEEETGGGGGMLEEMKGEDDGGGVVARCRAGRTTAGPEWTLSLIKLRISSISDWEFDGWSGIVSLWEFDISFFEN